MITLLMTMLGSDSSLAPEDLEILLVNMFGLAHQNNNWNWIFKAQREALIFFSVEWIVANLTHYNPRKNMVIGRQMSF